MPNPANDQFTIHFNAASDRTVLLYDASGRLAKEFYGVTNTELSVDVKELARGLYNLIILDATAGTSSAYRVVVN
jgi:hypothetical protein